MRTKKMKWMFSTPLSMALLLLSVCTASAADKVICVPWEGDPAKPHTAISGTEAQLTCVVKTDANAGTRYYKWVYGDGSESVPTLLGSSVSSKYNLDTTHAYIAAAGTPFTAQLLVASNNAVLNPETGTYRLKLEDNSLDARINLAIDKGLWWLYKNGATSGTQTTWYQSSYSNTYTSPTASAIQAFAINNHKIYGDPNIDPYVESVQGGMNFLTKGNALFGVLIGSSTYDMNNNGYGVQTVNIGGSNPMIYEGGQVIDAIIASGVLPSDSTGRSFSNTTKIWTYGELLQDLADMYIYNQSGAGGWGEYVWGGSSDNSSSQWAAIGMLPAQAAPWNVIVPQFIKDNNKNWMNSSYCNQGGSLPSGYFGYQGGCGSYNDNALNTTACGMVQMNFDGMIGYNDPSTPADERELKWAGAERFITNNWWTLLETGSPSWGGNRTYGFYSLAKAMRLANPHPVETVSKSSGQTFDWYRGGTSFANDANYNKGLAQRIVELQDSTGYWSGNLTNLPLTTAWMVITLKPTLFASSPTACFSANPNPTYSLANITFDPSCSGHSETGKTIANLTKFEWDWDNNGTFDASSTTPTLQTHAFTCPSPPCTFPVKLKVTDDNNPALTATYSVDVKITNPPHPPIANAGGPYVASLCQADTLTLDGSASFHPDLGQFEAGCTTCVGAKIIKYDWDLLAPLTDFTNASSVDPTKMVTVTPASIFTTAGSTAIALRVTDNAKSGPAFPNSNLNADQTGTAFGSVDVKAACLCTLTAIAKAGMVQLNWVAAEHSATKVYDIYRSTVGPNTGFTKIRSGYTNALPLFVNTGLTNGTKYYYRVDSMNAAGAPCESVAVSATPKLLAR